MSLSIITLNVKVLNTLIKRYKNGYENKTSPQETHLRIKDTYRLTAKGYKKILHVGGMGK